ncbi:MAG TPA: sterol desaturase family protein [Microthrixaceae bacterium]|nr:sterol desaturase family protein [Microthrixaceae bacterium]
MLTALVDVPVERLLDSIRSAPKGELVSATCYLAVITAGVGEWAWLKFQTIAGNVRNHLTAAVMGAGGMTVGVVVTAVWLAMWGPLASLSPAVLARTWDANPLLGAVAAFIAWDAASWVYHVVGHRTSVGWASHQVHHSGRDYNLSLAWRQSWLPIPALFVFPPLALFGFRLSTLGVCAAISSLYQALCHYSGKVSVPRPIAWILVSPESHRRHHVADAEAANFGAVLTIWDRLTGTWDPMPTTSNEFGIPGRSGDEGPLSTELAGWLGLWRRRHEQRLNTSKTGETPAVAGVSCGGE